MNQFHLYPHQVYRRNTRNNLYADDSKGESPLQDDISKRLKTTNPKEINISEFEDQKQRRIQTEASPDRQSERKQIGQRNKLPSITNQSSKKSKTGVDIDIDQIENQERLSSRKSKNDKQQKKVLMDDDGDIFDKKPRSTTLIDNNNNTKGFVDAQQIIDNTQRERLPSINKSNKQSPNRIDILNRYQDENSPNQLTQSRQQQQNTKRSSQSRGSSRNEHKKSQDPQLNKSLDQQSNQQQKARNSQINFDQKNQNEDQKDLGLDINVSLQDIAYDSSAPRLEQKNREKQTSKKISQDGQDEQQQKNKKENVGKNASSLLQKYKLEQEYLKGLKQKSNTNLSVLNESLNNQSPSKNYQMQENGNDSDESEDTRLNNKINNYRNHYRKSIDEIYRQIKTEHNSPSSRSIYYHEEAINKGLIAQGKLKTEPNDDSKNHNLTICRPSIDYNTSLSRAEEDDIENIQNQSKTVPIHMLLDKIKQRSTYTQKLERLSSNLNGISPNKSLAGSEDINQSQLAFDHLKIQRQYITSKKYLNMYSRTIDSLNNYDSNGEKSGRKINENSNLNNTNNSQNGLVIRNIQKSNGGIYGINKTLDIRKLNDEIDKLEQQSKVYQNMLKISIDCSIDFSKNVPQLQVNSNIQ